MAVTAVFLVRRRRPEPVAPEIEEPEKPAVWPPVPILGLPTEDDFARMRGEHTPRKPRRPLPRWAVAGLALAVVAGLGQWFVYAVFDKAEVPSAPGYECEYPGCGSEAGFDEWDEDLPGDLTAWYGSSAESIDGVVSPEEVAVGIPEAVGVDTALAPPAGADADCAPQKRRPVVAAPAKKTVRQVNRQWRRIEKWLAANAPESYATLAGPATPKMIAKAEATMGLRFPDALRASLLRHNGTVSDETWGFGFMAEVLMTADGIATTWQELCESENVDYGDRDDWWDGRMIPFSVNGGGDSLVIDSVVGDVGQTDHEGTMSFDWEGVTIGSYLELLRLTADALEKGGQVGYWKPKAVGGEVEWDVL